MSEEAISEEPEIFVEILHNIRYLVVKHGEISARERIPLHVFNMTDEKAKLWFMRSIISRVKRKMHRKLREKQLASPNHNNIYVMRHKK